jgi:hypothetical protein
MAVVSRIRSGKALAECLSGDAEGALVYIRDTISGGRYRVASADPSTSAKMPVAASIYSKQSATECVIQFQGLTSIYTGLISGSAYVLGTDSQPARIGDLNYPSGVGYLVQQVGVAVDDDGFYFAPMDVFGGSGSAGPRYFQQSLIGLINGSNTTFYTAVPFKHGGVDTESLFYNGQALDEGSGNDYVVSESGGPGTGYDKIDTAFVPRDGQKLVIDFVPDI